MGYQKKSKTVKARCAAQMSPESAGGARGVINTDRVLRSRRGVSVNRRLNGFVSRPPKRLFTQEIKRKLKQWLVKRRRYPYPTREEKRLLAQDTGLEYSQICNWFANWRRKLKNAEGDERRGADVARGSWGRRILRYNDVAARNAERIPVTDEDGMLDQSDGDLDSSSDEEYLVSDCSTLDTTAMDHCYSRPSPVPDRNGNYKTSRDADSRMDSQSKWLASVQSFTPTRSRPPATHLFVSWASVVANATAGSTDEEHIRNREEIDAAEALTTLARVSRAKIVQQQ